MLVFSEGKYPDSTVSLIRFEIIFFSFKLFILFQASGVTVTDACKQVFEKIKTKKDYRYVVFYIKDEKFIDVESTGIELIYGFFFSCLIIYICCYRWSWIKLWILFGQIENCQWCWEGMPLWSIWLWVHTPVSRDPRSNAI